MRPNCASTHQPIYPLTHQPISKVVLTKKEQNLTLHMVVCYQEVRMKKVLSYILLFYFLFPLPSFAEKTGFTQEDRERLVRLEATLKVFMQQVDKRF